MNIVKAHLFFKVKGLLLILIWGSVSSASGIEDICEGIFSKNRQNYQMLRTELIRNSPQVNLPKFSSPLKEINDSKTWSGLQGPRLLNELLPQGVSFISHQLQGNYEEGLVKSHSGLMVHLRAQVGKFSTNIGVNINSLKSNLYRKNKSLVSDDAEAVVVFIHGGGTKTTGHHVAASLMNWMNSRNVDVVSLDMPWHAEGDRVSFDSVKDSLESLREYIKAFVSPSGKPVILSGHSMGGVIADLYLRNYPNDNLVTAVIPLSTVADSLPGKSVSEKIIADSQIAQKNLTNTNIPESERFLADDLAKQNKISPTCGMYCHFLVMGIDWTPPKDKGVNYLPSLYIIGEGDSLYQGYQNNFKDGVASLVNSEFKVLTPRRSNTDRKGDHTVVGHLIFDHYPLVELAGSVPEAQRKSLFSGAMSEAEYNQLISAGLAKVEQGIKFEDLTEPETFVLMRNFIAKVLQKPLLKVKKELSALDNVMYAYANNLLFRDFAKNYTFLYSQATEKGNQVGKDLQVVGLKIKSLESLSKKSILTPEQENELSQLRARKKELTGILTSKGKVSEQNFSRFQQVMVEVSKISDLQMPALVKERKNLKSELDQSLIRQKSLDKFILENEHLFRSARLSQIRQGIDRAFHLMMEQEIKVRKLTNAYLLENHKNGQYPKNLFENMPIEITREFERYSHHSQLYQDLLLKYKVVLAEELKNHRISVNENADAEKRNMIIQSISEISTNLRKIEELKNQLIRVDSEISRLATNLFYLEKQMIEINGSEYFVSESITIEKLLSVSTQEGIQNKEYIDSILQKIWGDWLKILSQRF